MLALTAGLVTLRMLDAPTLAQQSLAAALGVLLAVGLAVRTGGQVTLPAVLALVVGVAAVATQWAPLLAGAALATAVLAACLGVFATRPAATALAVVREVVVAVLVAAAGGIAASGFSVGIDRERFTHSVLVLALVATVALAYRLGGGLHGLGRRGLLLVVGALVLLVVVLVYTAALTRYGSPELIAHVRSAHDWTREQLGGVPHPVEVIVGVPALAWGVSVRARRRQGWWVCVFGTAATAHLAGDLVGRTDTVVSSALGAVYGLLLGLLLGAVVIRLERAFTGRDQHPGEHAPDVRVEPSRQQALH
jgi:hypothetical protein